jgi:hypothetical protein
VTFVIELRPASEVAYREQRLRWRIEGMAR